MRKRTRCGRVRFDFGTSLRMVKAVCAWTMELGEIRAPTGRAPVRSSRLAEGKEGSGGPVPDRRKRSSGWLAFPGFFFDFCDGTCSWQQMTDDCQSVCTAATATQIGAHNKLSLTHLYIAYVTPLSPAQHIISKQFLESWLLEIL